jgi:hypothetical protein
MRYIDPNRPTLIPPTTAEAAATASQFERRGPLQRLRRLPASAPQPRR